MSDDDAPARARDGDVEVERDHGCFRGLTWRTAVAAGDGERLRRALIDAGLADLTADPRLIAMRTADDHHVVIVAASGRAQIRLRLDTAERDRAAEALAVAALVRRATGP